MTHTPSHSLNDVDAYEKYKPASIVTTAKNILEISSKH